jgi:hypothetical protein
MPHPVTALRDEWCVGLGVHLRPQQARKVFCSQRGGSGRASARARQHHRCPEREARSILHSGSPQQGTFAARPPARHEVGARPVSSPPPGQAGLCRFGSGRVGSGRVVPGRAGPGRLAGVEMVGVPCERRRAQGGARGEPCMPCRVVPPPRPAPPRTLPPPPPPLRTCAVRLPSACGAQGMTQCGIDAPARER